MDENNHRAQFFFFLFFTGLESGVNKARKSYWATVLGTLVAVVIVVAVSYVILRRKYQRDYSHRKLIEDYPSEPGNFPPINLLRSQFLWDILSKQRG